MDATETNTILVTPTKKLTSYEKFVARQAKQQADFAAKLEARRDGTRDRQIASENKKLEARELVLEVMKSEKLEAARVDYEDRQKAIEELIADKLDSARETHKANIAAITTVFATQSLNTFKESEDEGEDNQPYRDSLENGHDTDQPDL